MSIEQIIIELIRLQFAGIQDMIRFISENAYRLQNEFILKSIENIITSSGKRVYQTHQ